LFEETVQSISRKFSADHREPFAHEPHVSSRWPWLAPIWVQTLQLQHVDILAAIQGETRRFRKLPWRPFRTLMLSHNFKTASVTA